MANIPVIAEINNLLDADTTAIAKTALGVLGAVTTGGALGTPTSGTLTNATGLPIDAGTVGTLTVAKGGTGATTLTSGSVLVGAGTSTPTFVAPSTAGNVLTSAGGVWTSAPAAGGTPADNSITTAMLQSGSVTAAKVTDGALTIAKTSGLQSAINDKITKGNVSGGISPLWKPLKRWAQTDSTLPIVVRSLTIADSWVANTDNKIAANFGRFGEVGGPIATCNVAVATTTGNIRSSGYVDYTKGSLDSTHIIHSAAGSSIWGGGNGTLRFSTTGSVLVVIYERVTGAGIVSVDFESTTDNVWTAAGVVGNSYTAAGGTVALPVASQINAASGAGSTELAIATFQLIPHAVTARIRITWVSGTVNIIGAGITNSPTNVTTTNTSRQGLVSMLIGTGGAFGRTDLWQNIPQASLNTLLGWLKPDLVFLRDKQEVDTATWITAFEALMAKLNTAYTEQAFIFPGRHPTGDGSEAESATKDAYLRTYATTNNHLFVPIIEFFPDYATYLSLGLGDAIHTATTGNQIIETTLWTYLTSVFQLTQQLSSGRSTGLRQMGDGVSNNSFFVSSNSTSAQGRLGIRDLSSGTTNLGIPWEVKSNLATTATFANGFTMSTGGQAFLHTEISAGRTSMTGTQGVMPTRVPGGLLEIYSANTTLNNLSLQSPSAQTANMMEVRTSATGAASGTLAFGISKAGIPFMPGFTTIARDALTGVVAGSIILNTTTSKLNFYTGSAWEAVTSA